MTTNEYIQSNTQSMETVVKNESNEQSSNTTLSKDSQDKNLLTASSKNSTKISVSSKTVTYGDQVNLTATVIDTKTNKYVQSGKVSIKLNGITYGDSLKVNNGKVSCLINTSTLSSKKYNITAVYGGNSVYGSSRSGTAYLTINKAPVSISLPYIKTIVGNAVTLKATVVDSNTNTYLKSGTVAFKINGMTISKASISNGKAAINYDTSKLSAKNYTISVIYGESTNYKSSTGSNSLVLVKHGTNTVVTNKTANYGNVFSLDIRVIDIATNTYAKSGKVALKIDGVTVANNLSVSNGKVAYSINSKNLKTGKHQITAVYGGDSTYNSSRSGTSYLTINKAPVRISVTNLTSLIGGSVVLKATITSGVTNGAISEGKVSFKVNGTTVGTVNVKNGIANLTYSTSKLSAKTHNITVVYQGSDNYNSQQAKGTLKITQPSYTFDQIKSAAISLRTSFESNNIVKTVSINGTKIPVQDLLYLMIQAVQNVKDNKGSKSIAYLHYGVPSYENDTIKAGKYQSSEILNIGKRVITYLNKNGKAPAYVNTSLGLLGYNNLIYTYTRTMEVCTTDYLVSTTRVYNWAVMHPSNPKTRTIYLTSDVIYTEAKDKAFINILISVFKSKGYKAVYAGYGPNSHNTVIWNEVMPINGVLVPIFGGADAGVIYDICTRSFMKQKENRMLFIVYNSNTSKDITGLKWLERAHDDNYSPSSFTGISYPDKYLTNHGYGYVYAADAQKIVNAIISYIS